MIPKIGDNVKVNPDFAEEYNEKVGGRKFDYVGELLIITDIMESNFDKEARSINWNDYSGVSIFDDGTFAGNNNSGKISTRWKTQVFVLVDDICPKCNGTMKEITLFTSSSKYCPTCEE